MQRDDASGRITFKGDVILRERYVIRPRPHPTPRWRIKSSSSECQLNFEVDLDRVIRRAGSPGVGFYKFGDAFGRGCLPVVEVVRIETRKSDSEKEDGFSSPFFLVKRKL